METWVWDSERLAYLRWKVLMPGARNPKTMKGLAKALGVEENTLVAWGKAPEFIDAQAKYSLNYLKEKMPEIVQATIENALTPAGDKDRAIIFRQLVPEMGAMDGLSNLAGAANTLANKKLSEFEVFDRLKRLPPEILEQVLAVLNDELPTGTIEGEVRELPEPAYRKYDIEILVDAEAKPKAKPVGEKPRSRKYDYKEFE